MSSETSRENILNKIRKALATPVPLPFTGIDKEANFFHQPDDDLDILFAQSFTKLQGKFVYCVDETDLNHQLQQLIAKKEWMKIYCVDDRWHEQYCNTIALESCDVSITGCELLVARTGTIIMSAAEQSGRTVSVYAPIHICIAFTNQLVYDIKDALDLVKNKYQGHFPSFITFASGPSRTADIEKTLVTGVHGPKEVYLFLVDKKI